MADHKQSQSQRDANRISLHDYYRWRLASAYSVIRDTIRHEGKPGPFGTIDFPGALLSGLSGQQPQLVLCTYRELGACSVTLALHEEHAGRRSGNAVAGVVGTT